MAKKSEFISVEATARRLDKSVKTIYRMLQDGRLGGRCEKGDGSEYATWSVSRESIELFEENTRLWSKFETQKMQLQTLF